MNQLNTNRPTIIPLRLKTHNSRAKAACEPPIASSLNCNLKINIHIGGISSDVRKIKEIARVKGLQIRSSAA